MAAQDVKRKLTTILAADVEGYSRLMSAASGDERARAVVDFQAQRMNSAQTAEAERLARECKEKHPAKLLVEDMIE